jgi:hypothetical protein
MTSCIHFVICSKLKYSIKLRQAQIEVITTGLISLRLGFRRNFLSVLHPNLVSSPIKGILEILNLTPRCIPMDILAWTECVRSSAGKIS